MWYASATLGVPANSIESRRSGAAAFRIIALRRLPPKAMYRTENVRARLTYGGRPASSAPYAVVRADVDVAKIRGIKHAGFDEGWTAEPSTPLSTRAGYGIGAGCLRVLVSMTNMVSVMVVERQTVVVCVPVMVFVVVTYVYVTYGRVIVVVTVTPVVAVAVAVEVTVEVRVTAAPT